MVFINSHGGSCCGYKHIYRLGTDPAVLVNAQSHIVPKRPRETAEIRFKASLHWIMSHYPSIMVEVILKLGYEPTLEQLEKNLGRKLTTEEIIKNCPSWQAKWEAVLFECGFKKKEEWYNSNSGNRLRRYSFCTGGKDRKKMLDKLVKEIGAKAPSPAPFSYEF